MRRASSAGKAGSVRPDWTERPSRDRELVRFPEIPGQTFARRFARALCRWFAEQARDFPWRHTRDPYAIWISEMMLQQTQAATVVPYFLRFCRHFPDLRTLAQAPIEKVLQLWQGLGYYRRALAIHRAAQILLREHGGQFPRDAKQWQRLPGIGRYTAHAILSQAFGLRLPIIEANSARVYARIFACDQPLTEPTVRRWLWQVAEQCVPARLPGVFNQAIMELGATVCRPRQPRCGECPVTHLCLAYQLGQVNAFPRPRPRPATIHIDEVALLIRRGDRWLALQRGPDADRWPLLWEFPHASKRPDESANQAAVRIARELTGLRIRILQPLGNVRFGVTRFRIAMTAYLAAATDGRPKLQLTPDHQAARWCKLTELPELAWSTPHRRLLSFLDGLVPPSREEPHR